jgi:hypothetical protein
MNEYIEEIEATIIDLLEGNDEAEIRYFTGLSEERCQEIYQTFTKVLVNYNKRHNLNSTPNQ